jgi:signal transduction histidine kinase
VPGERKCLMAKKVDAQSSAQASQKELAHGTQDQGQTIAHLKRILDVTRSLNLTLDLESQITMIQDVATSLTDTVAASIFLRDSNTDELFFLSATGQVAERIKRIPVPMESSIAGWVVNSGQPAVVNDVQRDERHYGGTDCQTQFVTRSILAVPLLAQGKIIGALEVVNKGEDRSFTDEDLELMTILGAQAAVAIEKARLFQQSDLISEVVHELRTPMTSVVGYAKLLTMEGIPEEKKREFAETIHREAVRLGQMVNDFLDWARLESGRERFGSEPVDVCRLVDEVVQVIQPQAEESRIGVGASKPEGELVVLGDRGRLKQVLLNLASNGVKYNHRRGRLDFLVQQADGWVTIAVRDTGVGIPSESLDKLFQRFYRVPGTESAVRGPGLGLSVTKSLVEAHGGEIEVQSTVGEGTTFTVRLPLAGSGPIAA